MEKNNNSSSNGFSNSEMYKKSIHHIIESVGFYTADLGLIKGKTTFAKAPNGTIACLLYSSYSNAATYYEKVGDRWLKLDEERTEAVKAELRKKGRKMVEAAIKEMEKNKNSREMLRNVDKFVAQANEWLNRNGGEYREQNKFGFIAELALDEKAKLITAYDGFTNELEFGYAPSKLEYRTLVSFFAEDIVDGAYVYVCETDTYERIADIVLRNLEMKNN